MEQDLLDADVGAKSKLLVLLEQTLEEIFDLRREFDVDRKGDFLADYAFLELLVVFGVIGRQSSH